MLSERASVAAELIADDSVPWLVLSHSARRAVSVVLLPVVFVVELLPDDLSVAAVGMSLNAGFAAVAE